MHTEQKLKFYGYDEPKTYEERLEIFNQLPQVLIDQSMKPKKGECEGLRKQIIDRINHLCLPGLKDTLEFLKLLQDKRDVGVHYYFTDRPSYMCGPQK